MTLPVFQNRKQLKIKPASAVLVLFLILFFIFLYFFNKSIYITPLYNSSGTCFEKARVVQIISDNLQADGSRAGSQTVKVEMLSGKYKGNVYEAVSLDSYLYGAACKVGTKVIVQLSVAENTVSASVYNYDRSSALYLLAAVFVFFIWLIGGKKGMQSLFALLFSLSCVLFLFIPLLYIGCSPFWGAVIIVVLNAGVTLYIMGGPTLKTLVSVISTIAGVIVAGLFASLFGSLAHLSGYNVSDVENLIFISQNSRLDVGGLLFSAILIGSLGATMDNSFSMGSAINELWERNPSISVKQLFQSGMNMGRDMMSTTTNTLIFAYTGSSVTVLISMYAYHYPYNQVINMYSIGIELLQALSATLGVVLTVPICAGISSWLYVRKQHMKDENHSV